MMMESLLPYDASNHNEKLLSSCPPLSWGILGTGRICHDFVQALKHLPSAKVVAVGASSSSDRASSFAEKHSIEAAYGNYQSLVDDPCVEIVYVGNVHAFRKEIGILVLNAGKHVLFEVS